MVSSIVSATRRRRLIDDVLDHVEGHDVAPELGLLDVLQGVEDLGFVDHRYLTQPATAARSSTRSSKVAPDRRSRYARPFMRLPQRAMEHQRPDRLRDES